MSSSLSATDIFQLQKNVADDTEAGKVLGQLAAGQKIQVSDDGIYISPGDNTWFGGWIYQATCRSLSNIGGYSRADALTTKYKIEQILSTTKEDVTKLADCLEEYFQDETLYLRVKIELTKVLVTARANKVGIENLAESYRLSGQVEKEATIRCEAEKCAELIDLVARRIAKIDRRFPSLHKLDKAKEIDAALKEVEPPVDAEVDGDVELGEQPADHNDSNDENGQASQRSTFHSARSSELLSSDGDDKSSSASSAEDESRDTSPRAPRSSPVVQKRKQAVAVAVSKHEKAVKADPLAIEMQKMLESVFPKTKAKFKDNIESFFEKHKFTVPELNDLKALLSGEVPKEESRIAKEADAWRDFMQLTSYDGSYKPALMTVFNVAIRAAKGREQAQTQAVHGNVMAELLQRRNALTPAGGAATDSDEHLSFRPQLATAGTSSSSSSVRGDDASE